MKRSTYLMLFVSLLAMSINCQASKQKERQDMAIKEALGDSLSNIVLNGSDMTAYVVGYDSLGHIMYNARKKLDNKQKHLFRFIIDDKDLYKSDIIVYGIFSPVIRYKVVHKKTVLYIDVDFGLNKWRVCDAGGKVIKTFDISGNNLIRIAHYLFPENDIITHFYEIAITAKTHLPT